MDSPKLDHDHIDTCRSAAAVLGDYQEALNHYNQALPIVRAIGDRAGEAATLNNIGFVQYGTGDFESAIEMSREALRLQTLIGDKYGESVSEFNIAIMLVNYGRNDDAAEHLDHAIHIARQIGNPAVPEWEDIATRLRKQTM